MLDLKLFGCETIFEEFQRMIVTDGQTDGRLTVASPRSANTVPDDRE